MNFKRYHVSKNLFSSVWEQGSINATDGQNVVAGTIVRTKDYISIKPNTAYSFSRNISNGYMNIRLYRADKSYIGSGSASTIRVISGTTDGNPMGTNVSFCCFEVIDVEAAYIRFNDASNNTATKWLMVEGEYTQQTMPAYEPYSSEVWHDIPHYIHNTSTDTLTTLPAVIYPTGTTATVGLKGQTTQSSIPSSTSPVMPQGTGNKTANLWNEEGFSARAITSTHEHTDTNTYGTTLSTTIGKETIITQSEYPTGTVGYQNGFFFIDVDFSKYEIGDKVTLSFDYICNEVHSIAGQVSTTLYAGKNSNSIPVVLSSGKWSVSGRLTAVITVIADMNPYVEVRLCGNSITVKNIMLNSGSQPLPFEPFGVKIPISSGVVTTPVYLGEVETTRKIKKLVLTGKESWQLWNGNYYSSVIDRKGAINTIVCSHFINSSTNGISYNRNDSSGLKIAAAVVPFVTSVSELTTYLAAQYAAGTPVTIWYVLATPTTGVVNEPLMRIGDYADTLSGITIPVTAGGDTLSIDTTVQPSEVTVNYKGWHPVADVHEFTGNYTVGTMQTLPISELETHTISDLQGGEWS